MLQREPKGIGALIFQIEPEREGVFMSDVTKNEVSGKPTNGRNAKEQRDIDMTMRFWHSVDTRLKDEHISRAELGRRTNLSNQSLTSAKYLKSKVNIFTVLRITKALDCTVEDLIYGSSSTQLHSEGKCVKLVEQAREEAESDGISALIKLFSELTSDEQLAVLIHVFSLLGVSPRELMQKLDATNNIGGDK